MQFLGSEELEMTRSVLRDFARSELMPRVKERDEHQLFDRALVRKMADIGLTGMLIPEHYGGAAGDYLTFAVVMEELAAVCVSSAAVLGAHTAFTSWVIHSSGTERLKWEHMHGLAQGLKLGGIGFPVRHVGGEDQDTLLSAHKSGDVHVLQGNHPCVVNAGIADLYILFARVQSGSRKRYQAYVVEKSTMGFEIGKPHRKIGLRSYPTANVVLKQCVLPEINRLGRASHSNSKAVLWGDLTYLSAAAMAVGIAQGAVDRAAAYARERVQFGRAIGRQQGIAFKLADMAVKLEAARMLTYQAAWNMDQRLPSRREAAMARMYSAEAAVSITTEAVQIFGGYGYMQEVGLERYMRDAKCLESDYGTGGFQSDVRSRIRMNSKAVK
ncbi:acyl-CoA dehydrogenase family protein [Paenibacillus guangzhouensis]|uniref:acyl-CoA dehydrogenase family protein n=1 Tax=Paenibacillus guangzhouensis TaxID=1473112 RepID=UPI00187BB431|nr:acyl-CoA dehydrogenase family protein [Paenibacillus guangzhouensis]